MPDRWRKARGVPGHAGLKLSHYRNKDGGGRLPPAYWTAWSLLAVVIAIEFVIVFWGGTLVSGQAEVSLATATLVVSALSLGTIVGRFGLSFRAVSERDPIWIIRGGIVVALLAAMMAWVSASFEFSMVAFFLAGLGLATLFPLGAALTMATAPLLASLASGRLVLATGFAILVAPFLLGVVADLTGVVAAWLLIPALCVVALALTVPISRARSPEPNALGA
jgi:fucose permease